MFETPISPKNLLSKLSFVRYGPDAAAHSDEFRRELNSFLRTISERSTVSRQAINYWFTHYATPVRSEAVLFLNQFFRTLSRDGISDDQKKVYDQLNAYFRQHRANAWEPISHHARQETHVYLSKTRKTARRVMLEYPISLYDLQRISTHLVGCYCVYHIRLVENSSIPLAREFMQIFLRGTELRFILWNQNDRSETLRFEGSIFLLGRTLWLLGLSNTSERLRVMAFRDLQADNLKYETVRWGILCSDIPRPSSPDPASARVIIWKYPEDIKDTTVAEARARQLVKNLTAKECREEPLTSVLRLVSQRTSAGSKPNSTIPLFIDESGGDPILKVEQQTIDAFNDDVDENWAEFHLRRPTLKAV